MDFQHSGHKQRQHRLNQPESTHRPNTTMLEEEQLAVDGAWRADDLATTATAKIINSIWQANQFFNLSPDKHEALNTLTHDNERGSNHAWMAKDIILKEDLEAVPHKRDDKYNYRASVVAYLDAASARRERIANAIRRHFMDRPGAHEAVERNLEASALLRDAAEMTQR
jgi:hypothetical protein